MQNTVADHVTEQAADQAAEHVTNHVTDQAAEQVTENKMGVMPIGRLLISMSLPMMISMLVQALYNIVDSIYVSQINENALTAVSLAFPLQSMMIAVGIGTAVGINAVLSKSLGEKNLEKVRRVANNGMFLAIVSYLVFLLIGLVAVEPFYLAQTESADTQIVIYGKEYLSVVMCCSFGLFFQVTLERLLQATGRTIYTMITQGTGAIINIILDPILIFGYLGFPAMGVRGAAVATVIGQVIAAILALVFNLTKNKEVALNVKDIRPEARILKQIYAVGVPSIMVQAGGSVMVYLLNQILLVFSTTATAVFGVYFKLQSFVFMPVFGLNGGAMPIVAYNYGAQKKDRLIRTVKLSAISATLIMVVGLLVFQLFPSYLLELFSASANMMNLGITALRIISISFIMAGFNIAFSTVFPALGNGMYGMIINVSRQLIVLAPVAWLLSLLGNVGYVWWAFPISELFSTVLTLIFSYRMYQTKIRYIGNIG